jgi:hypothetical protein
MAHFTFVTRPYLGLLGAVCLLAPLADGLEATPATIVWNSIHEKTVVQLSHDGNPVAPAAVTSVKLFASGHDYDHMIQVDRSGPHLVVQPSEMLELGTYDLVLEGPGKPAVLSVQALLPIVDNSLAARAKRQGISVEALRQQLGISQPLGEERLDLGLPPSYYVGQTLVLDLPTAPDRTATLLVNGEPADKHHDGFRFVFQHPGIHDVSYVEAREGRTVAMALDTVVVAREPKIPVSVTAGATLTLQGPDGYEEYAWWLDQTRVGSEKDWARAFEKAGTHDVMVQAVRSTRESLQPLRELTYRVTVQDAPARE